MTPLASDSKLRRTVNLRRKMKGKTGKKKKKEGKREKKEKTKRKRMKKKKKKKTISLYLIVCIEIYTFFRGYGMHKMCRKMLYY